MSRNPHIVTRSATQHAAQAAHLSQPQGTLAQDDQPMADEAQEGYASSTPTSSLTWIAWFCSLPGHEYFCEVTEDFIEDDFNLTGLSAMVPFWKEAMEMVLDVEPEDTHKIPDVAIVEASAELLYGLVHQRYILTRPGLQSMAEKYENGVFGSCLRVYCSSTRLIPCGRSDMPGVDTVKLFCPNCNDIYTPSSSRFSGVDGAFFGTTFAHLFFHTYREYSPSPFIPPRRPSTTPSANNVAGAGSQVQINPNQYGGQKRPEGRVYIPKIYGFKVSERAKSGPRMTWLRMRPNSFEELNSVDSRGRWVNEGESDDEDRRGPGGGGRRGRFDDDDDPDEPIDEDEEEEEDGVPGPPAWAASAGQMGGGRRPHGGSGGRLRAVSGAPISVDQVPVKAILEGRKRRPQRPQPQSPCSDPSTSEAEDNEEDSSGLETPAEVFIAEVGERKSDTLHGKKMRELAAITLAKFVGKDVKDMFAGIPLRTGPHPIFSTAAVTTAENDTMAPTVLAL